MKATFPDGTVFEGTPEEFVTIRAHSTTANNGHKSAPKAGNGNPPVWDETKARAFWDSLDPRRKGGKQKKVLEYLIKHNGRATPEALRNHLGIEGEPGQKLAGVLANITRNARRETKSDEAQVVDWMSDGKGGCYYIPDGVLQLLKGLE
jgi:hypothetical protein